jgi:YHS domain-containing protein
MRFLIAILSFGIVLSLAGGCAPKAGDDAKATPGQAAADGAAQAPAPPATPAEGQVVAHRNAEGQLVCPVMGQVIQSEADAAGYQDHEGKRYYFCCALCPDRFRQDPGRYATQ